VIRYRHTEVEIDGRDVQLIADGHKVAVAERTPQSTPRFPQYEPQEPPLVLQALDGIGMLAIEAVHCFADGLGVVLCDVLFPLTREIFCIATAVVLMPAAVVVRLASNGLARTGLLAAENSWLIREGRKAVAELPPPPRNPRLAQPRQLPRSTDHVS